MDDHRYDRLVGDLYASALAPEAQHGALRELARCTQADNFHLMTWRVGEATPTTSTTWGMDPGMEASYQAHYGALDPRRLLVARSPAGQWTACHHHFDASTVNRSEFFQDYLIPGDIRWLLGSRVTRRQGHDVFFGLHRAPGQAPFSPQDLALVHRLTGHFQRALHLWLDTAELRQHAELGAQALDRLEHGVLAVDAQGRLVFANRYGQALLREAGTLRVRRSRVSARDDADAARLGEALRRSALTGQPQSLRLLSSDGAPAGACFVTIAPLPANGPLTACTGRAALLLLVNRAGRRILGVQQLMQLFALTPAEARLARQLASGQTQDAYAQANGLTTATTRTQLRAVLAKTGLHRQADLVRLLSGLPAVR